MTAKVNNAMVLEAIKDMRAASKVRKFTQAVEIQLGLKDYDP
jgi:ribosomal protein L1